MGAKRRVNNLTALAVLATVYQRPMHRYEMASLIKAHGKDRDMDVKWGSLYTVVQNLEKHRLLEAIGTHRQGARPERTIYRITEAGVEEMIDWTRELLLVPERENPRFMAGLSLIMVLPPGTVIALLTQRLEKLEDSINEQKATLTHYSQEIPRLFMIEGEYAIAMTEAEAAWVRSLLAELVDGTFPNLDIWTSGSMPPELVELAERGADPTSAENRREP